MDPCLTQDIPVAIPLWRPYSALPPIKGYSEVSSITPILSKFLGGDVLKEGQLNSETLFGRLVHFSGSGECQVQTTDKKKHKSYCKVSHLLDPIRTIQNFYSNSEKGVKRMSYKLSNPMNQAYIDYLANYLLGQLREKKVSPHFCSFYGGFKAIADSYRFNITEDFQSYRKYRDFWKRRADGLFKLHIEKEDLSDSESEGELSKEDLKYFSTPKSSLRSSPFSYNTNDDKSTASHTSLTHNQESADVLVELESVGSFKSASTHKGSTDSNDEETDNMYSVYVELDKYPVMLIFQEVADGVLDDLLDDDDAVDEERGSPEWEEMWFSWTFQVVAALSVAQSILGFTHNDLHTNNIVWKSTDEPFLYYKSRDGTMWKVPTYGKIMRIIDFGRSVFRVGEKWFISDDYEVGGDAAGQYNFGPAAVPEKPTIYPNPSFDLCRYSVSIIEALFPVQPPEKEGGSVLNTEGDWIIRETKSPLWNLLWSWLLDDKGHNVLNAQDGREKFPDFDLYQHIAEHVFTIKPHEQLRNPAFDIFKTKETPGDWETVYPLFA